VKPLLTQVPDFGHPTRFAQLSIKGHGRSSDTWTARYLGGAPDLMFSVQIFRAFDRESVGPETQETQQKGMIQVSQPISEHDAAAQKRSIHPHTGKQWHFANFATTQAAVNFLNAPPAQVAGEISATARNDGTVGLFYFL
jgi:hypothetical protein